MEALGPIAAVASIASAGMSVLSGGQAQQGGALNQQIANQNAQIARDKAQADAADIEVKNRKAMGSIRAGAGASGLLASDGSPLEATMSSAATGELNRQRRLWQGDLEARTDEIGGYSDSVAGNSAAMKAYGNAGSSLLTGISKVKDLLNPSAPNGRVTSTQIGGPDGFGGLG